MTDLNGKTIDVEKGVVAMGVKTYVAQFVATVGLTITGCSFYYGIIISDLKTQLNTSNLEKNQLSIQHRIDSTATKRSEQLEELIYENKKLREALTKKFR